MTDDDTSGDSTYQAAIDRQHKPPASVTPLRMPGQPPPEAHAVALERLLEAMCLCGTINRDAATAYLMALKLTGVSAPYGEHGVAVAKLLTGYQKRLEAHLATVPNRPPPPPNAA
jgi:hypothetical protein